MTLKSIMIPIALIAATSGVMSANSALAQENSSRQFNDLKWEQAVPGLAFALVWGDWTKGDFGMIARIDAGQVLPRHFHTSDYHAMTIQGNWVHSFDEGDDRSLNPGGYAFQAGKQEHGDRCEGTQDCLILVQQQGARDFYVKAE